MNRQSDPTTIVSFLRTAVAGLMVGGIGYAGGWVYTTLSPNARLQQAQQELSQVRTELEQSTAQIADQQLVIDQLGADLQVSQARVDQLSTSIRLLKVDRRVAEIIVLRQDEDPDAGLFTEFAFQEIDRDGNPIDSPRTFRIAGDMVYVDYWVVKFNDEFVEMAALDRGTSICLFRRIFGEFQEPQEGFVLDPEGNRPKVYGGESTMSPYEQQIWSSFWEIANRPAKAAQLGIRAAHGEAVATKLVRGQKYRIRLRASDGLTISPVGAGNPSDDMS